MADLKRTYTIPLRRGYNETPRHRRAKRAMSVLKTFLAKHMKSETIKIGKELNEIMWKNGMKNPPARVTVDVTKDSEGVVRAQLEGKEYVDFKPAEEQAAPKNIKEKLQQAVSEKAASKVKAEDKKEAAPAKPAEKKEEAKATPKPAAPKAESAPKADSKPDAKPAAPAKEEASKTE